MQTIRKCNFKFGREKFLFQYNNKRLAPTKPKANLAWAIWKGCIGSPTKPWPSSLEINVLKAKKNEASTAIIKGFDLTNIKISLTKIKKVQNPCKSAHA